MRTLALLAVLSSSVLAQSNHAACSLAPDIEKEYLALPSMFDLSKSWEERYAPRRALADKYSADWPLQFTLQQPILQLFDIGREWDLALAHYRALPDHLLEAGFLLLTKIRDNFSRAESGRDLRSEVGR